jgi:nucleoside-diphosphate-sugar epimerase
VHIEDAASATVAAVDNGGSGVYNVVDGEPIWRPRLPAPAPMAEVRGGSNAKAKSELGWQPRWPTWRVGFAKGLGENDGIFTG